MITVSALSLAAGAARFAAEAGVVYFHLPGRRYSAAYLIETDKRGTMVHVGHGGAVWRALEPALRAALPGARFPGDALHPRRARSGPCGWVNCAACAALATAEPTAPAAAPAEPDPQPLPDHRWSRADLRHMANDLTLLLRQARGTPAEIDAALADGAAVRHCARVARGYAAKRAEMLESARARLAQLEATPVPTDGRRFDLARRLADARRDVEKIAREARRYARMAARLDAGEAPALLYRRGP